MISKNLSPWSRRFLSFRGFSIQQRLPLLICLLLLAVMVTFGVISYVTVWDTAFKKGAQGLHSRSQQFASIFGQSAQSLITATRNVASSSAVKEYMLKNGSNDSVEGAFAAFSRDTLTVMTELLDPNGHAVYQSGRYGTEKRVDFSKILPVLHASDTARIGRIRLVGDSMFFPVIAGIKNGDQLSGFLVRWRKMLGSPRSMDQIRQLMGNPPINFYFGNSDNSVWTDMYRPTPITLPEIDNEDSIYKYESAGNKVIAVIKPIPNTPWLVLAENKQKDLLGSAQSFLKSVVLIGGILIVIGIFVAWLMSRNITRPLNKLTDAASAIASGDYTASVELNRRDELGKLGRAFNAMSSQVSKAKELLEQKILESEQMNEQLRNLSAHLQNIREEERIHIAREMHDELGQFLTGLKMDIAWLNKKLGSGEDIASKREKLTEMSALVDEAVVFVRKLAAELRPSILDDLGLIAALEWHSREFTRRFNIEVSFIAKMQELATSKLVATGLFRMYQESLTNVARHAEAKKVEALLDVIDGHIQLSITDDGKGFDTNNQGSRATLGLLGMKERALMIGGKLEIISQPGKGTTILIVVPLLMESPQKAVVN